MRIISMAVAALIAMTAGAMADQKTTAKDAIPKFPSKDYEILVPEGWSVVTYDEVDSSCIGDVSDPKCALETSIACGVYKALPCGGLAPKEPRGYFVLYRILKTESVLKIRSYRVDDGRGIYQWRPKRGDMHFVVEKATCDGKFRRDVGYICDMRKNWHYFLRKQADGNWTEANIFNF
jgi:hypothetical protein